VFPQIPICVQYALMDESFRLRALTQHMGRFAVANEPIKVQIGNEIGYKPVDNCYKQAE
jgi:hypothetical protein